MRPALTPFVIQTNHCHLSQLKPATLYCTNIHSSYQNSILAKFVNQKEEQDRADSLTRLRFTLKDSHICSHLSIQLKQQTNRTEATSWW